MSMHAPIVRHTLIIFDQLRNPLPPLFPGAAAEELEEAISALRAAPELSLTVLEDVMAPWGKRLWPYRKAFADLMAAYEDRLGHRFIQAQLPGALADRYREFEEHGGRFRDVVLGPPQPFFSNEDHEPLRDAILLAYKELRQHTVQGALSVDKDRYVRLVEEYREVLREIERTSVALAALAAREAEDHPALADEIQSYLCGIDHGFCALGPAPTLHSVRNAFEHFLGRKKEKKWGYSGFHRLI